MKGLNFEKQLNHQIQAVESVVAIFRGLEMHPLKGANKKHINPVYNDVVKQGAVLVNHYLPHGQFEKNIIIKQKEYAIDGGINPRSNIIDIMMETGTGKTYTYTKTIYELHKQYTVFVNSLSSFLLLPLKQERYRFF